MPDGAGSGSYGVAGAFAVDVELRGVSFGASDILGQETCRQKIHLFENVSVRSIIRFYFLSCYFMNEVKSYIAARD